MPAAHSRRNCPLAVTIKEKWYAERASQPESRTRTP
jgi:hypothetical protein